MSDSDESAVMVEHNDAPPELTDETEEEKAEGKKNPAEIEIAHAAQIVSIGSEEDLYAFTFHKARWNDILSRVPVGWKVAVVSVVGAFRTGKSFLLSWFLRYLYALEAERKEKEKGVSVDEKDKKPWYKSFESVGRDGFDWKAGKERNTTGIWMWSHPFFVDGVDGEPLAVLLVDTQGMFDHETSMALTASIFGLSTLLSSYQIYNVDKRIQEDNLQQLAMFTEYGRFAMGEGEQESKPFQKIEFLVRDWQHFDDDDETNYEEMEKSVANYLKDILAEREVSDLKETREHIQMCFDEITCYALSHPGFAVEKKKYDGDVSVLEERFVALLDRYCKRVFSAASLKPKQIHDRELTAAEFGTYIQEYADLFASGAKFPAAATLLEATATANNNNAIQLGLAEYKDRMERVAGPKCTNYIRPEELVEEHRACHKKALTVFRSIATFGSRKSVDNARELLTSQLESSWQVYESLNNGRNPLLGLEVYIIPMSIALVAYIMRILTDYTCSPYSEICKASSEVLSHLYAFVVCFVLIIVATKARQLQEFYNRVAKVLSAAFDNNAGVSKTKKND